MRFRLRFLTALLLWCSLTAVADEATLVSVATVTESRQAPQIWAPGNVISRADSSIAAENSGVLLQVLEVGTRVEQGQELARLKQREWQLQRQRDEAEVKRLQARLAFSQRQLERTQRLSASQSEARFRLDELQMEYDVLEQEIALAQAALASTEYRLQRSVIRAPFAGIVAARQRQPGEYVNAGDSVVRLVSVQQLELSVRAPVDVQAYVQAGDAVQVRRANGELLDSQVRAVIPVGDERSRMLEVRVALPQGFVVGQGLSVALPQGPAQMVKTIPRDALVLRQDAVYVYRLTDGKAERLVVQPGEGEAERIAITGPLQVGDQVIIRGAERLRPGQAVRTS
ncbi:hemolysin D [Bacterioplanes sanyensis]|uniref:efflux RND transporter periplasmic adaptor subunit n=1 Tax=Bacterioplanes sanyensis TaxID=1249553 RepID=UPI001677B1DB|nr:efflux RND transporter periplasmic adaptor subunit [Bacterioplanes sanyensis]GGY56432.1 hemolysin D [Bacterioplanes sanyensis]